MSTLKVSKVEPVTTGGDCNVYATNIVGNKNLIINGAMEVAQRGTSTSTNNTLCVDRFKCFFGGHNEAPTFAQVSLTSSDTGPWAKGFRKALQITNGNQTGGAGGSDEVDIYHQIEAQNLASSGWDYTSASSYITLSYWVKSSVAQNFYGYMVTSDGTSQMYLWETGSLTANTWTKVTKKIPGNSNLQFDSNNGVGLGINFGPFYGTDYTTANATLGSWSAWDGTARMSDNTADWWVTDNALFSITGVQLEVNDVATAFEHRTYADYLAECQRYYFRMNSDDGDATMFGSAWFSSNAANTMVRFPVTMRDTPSSLEQSGTASNYRVNWSGGNTNGTGVPAFSTAGKQTATFSTGTGGLTDGQGGFLRSNSNDAYLAWSAEF